MATLVQLYDGKYARDAQLRKKQKATIRALGQILGVAYDMALLNKALSDPSRWYYTPSTKPNNKMAQYSWTRPNGKAAYVKKSAYKTGKINKITTNPCITAKTSVVEPEQTLAYIKTWLEFHKNRRAGDEFLPALPSDIRTKHANMCDGGSSLLSNLNYNNSNVKRHVKVLKYFNILLNPQSDFGTRYLVDVGDPAWYSKLLKHLQKALKHRLTIEGHKKDAADLRLKKLVTYPKYKKASKLKMKKLEKRGEITLLPLFSIMSLPSNDGISSSYTQGEYKKNQTSNYSSSDVSYASTGDEQSFNTIGSRLFSSYFRKNRVADDGSLVTHSSLTTGSTTYPPPPIDSPPTYLPPVSTPTGYDCRRPLGGNLVEPLGGTTTVTLTSTTNAGQSGTSQFATLGSPYSCIKEVRSLKSPECYQKKNTTKNVYCSKHTMPKTSCQEDVANGTNVHVHMCHEIVDSDCPKPSHHDSMVKTCDLHETRHACDYSHRAVKDQPISSACLSKTIGTPAIYSPDKLCKLKRFFALFRQGVISELPQVLASLESASEYIKFMKGEETAWAEKSTMLDVLKKYQEDEKKKKAGMSEITEMGSKLDVAGKNESTLSPLENKPFEDATVDDDDVIDDGLQNEIGAKNAITKSAMSRMTREQLLRNSSASFVFQLITGDIEYSKYELGENFEDFLAIYFPKDDLRVMMAVVEIIVPELADFIHNMLKDRELMRTILSKKDAENAVKRQLSTLDVLIKNKMIEHKNLLEAAFKEAEVRRQEEKLRAENDIMQTTGVVEKMDRTTTVYNEVDSDEDDGGEESVSKFDLNDAMSAKKPDIGETLMGSSSYGSDIAETLLESNKLPEFIDPTTKLAIEDTRKMIGEYEKKVKALNGEVTNLKKEEVAQYTILIKNKEKKYLNFGEFQNTITSLNKDPRVSTEEYTNMLKLMAIGARITDNGDISLEEDSESHEDGAYFENPTMNYNVGAKGGDRSTPMVNIGSNMNSRPAYPTHHDLLIDEHAIKNNMFEVPENSCGYNAFEANLVLHSDKLARRAEVLQALDDYKNDKYDLENQLENGMLVANIKNEALKPGLDDVFTDEEFKCLMNGYLSYPDDIVTEDEASLISDNLVCKHLAKQVEKKEKRLEKLRLLALQQQAGCMSGPLPPDQPGGTTTITLTTTATDGQ